MLSVKTRKAADTIFKDFGVTQLGIKPSLPCFVDERSNHYGHEAGGMFSSKGSKRVKSKIPIWTSVLLIHFWI